MRNNLFLCFLFLIFCLIAIRQSSVVTTRLIPPVNSLADYQHPPVPQIKNKQIYGVGATNFIIIDSATNTILLSKNPNDRIYPASLTKLATALTALNVYPLDEVVTTTEYKEGKVMGLVNDEKITVRTLVSALLVFSANDAAYNLANNYSGGMSGFIDQMNLISQKYGLKNTNFVNVDGIHSPDHYSTVYDLSQLARIAIKNPVITEVVKLPNITVTDISGATQYQLPSTNELLGVVPEIKGLKTGWTPEASGCFIALIDINGHYLISVVVQSQDRFADTKIIVDWLKSNISWQSYNP